MMTLIVNKSGLDVPGLHPYTIRCNQARIEGSGKNFGVDVQSVPGGTWHHIMMLDSTVLDIECKTDSNSTSDKLK